MAGESGKRTIRIGIDVGGTFTDLYLLDEANGRALRHKLPSTPEDPYRAPIRGIREILQKAGSTAASVQFVGLGTTVATNALLERKGAVTGLITTAGFRDLLEIGRQKRPHLFDLFVCKTEPLVPRERRLEVVERVDANGSVATPIDETSIAHALDTLVERGVRSIAVCLLNSYANPVHEVRVLEVVRARHPQVAVTSSQELVPEFREFERLSSTVVNAYLMPIMKAYLTRFTEEVRALGIPDPPFVMSSGGGVVTPELAIQRPIDLLLSGPSGGVSGALYHAAMAGRPNIITFDMGGTSTDVCLIQDARADVAHGRTIDGLPIRSTSMDIHTVGAGGSSIAWIDAGLLLRIGPHSAGASPGPACYGVEGAKATVTDANVLLGRLNQHSLLDGALPIDSSKSRDAIEQQIAQPRGISTSEASAAIFAVSNVNIAQAIRYVSVQRGFDPSDFTLVAFGGAGPLHAAAVARELDMEVLVPPGPGVLCAMGVLTKDIQLNLSQTRLVRGPLEACAAVIADIFATLESRASATFVQNDLDTSNLQLERTADVRYKGQSFELPIRVEPGAIGTRALEKVRNRFDGAHKRLYGYDKPTEAIEFVTFRLKASLPVPKPDLVAAAAPKGPVKAIAPIGTRETYFETADAFVGCPIYRRSDFVSGNRIAGPAIIEQMDTTTVIPPDFDALADEWGNLILTQKRTART